MDRLTSLLGLFVMLGIAWLLSTNRRRIPWRVVGGGLALQFCLALLVLKTPQGQATFDAIGDLFNQMLGFVDEGSDFIFGIEPRDDAEAAQLPPRFSLLRTFAFGVLPTIIFFSSLMAVLYHLGLMQRIVQAFAWLMQRSLGTSGAETLSAAANIFVGQTEAPLVVRPYIGKMTMSELNSLMVGGFATIAGGVMAAYVSMGMNAGHLLTASVISAPAALLIAKLMVPETQTPETLGQVPAMVGKRHVNLIEAAAEGATTGLKLALNVGAVLLAFVALIAAADALLGWIGTLLGYVAPDGTPRWTLTGGLAYLFAPLARMMGIAQQDCLAAGELLGLRTVANEFFAFEQMGEWLKEGSDVQLAPRSQMILTYALCGFANFSSIGIQLGGIGGLAPERRSDLARLGLRAMIGGMLAAFMTACIAGFLLES